MAYTTIYAIITNKYPNRKEQLLGMLEASFGIGLICGPLAGASLYNLVGFERTFYIYGTFFLICTFLLWYTIPELDFETGPSIETGGSGDSVITRQERNRIQSDENLDDESSVDPLNDSLDGEEKVTFSRLICKHPVYLMSALAGTQVQFIYSYMEPILARRMEEMDLSQVQIGWFFMILPAAYIPSAMIIEKFPKRWDKRVVIISGMVFCALSLFFVGPTTIINFNEDSTLAIMIAGQVLLGLAIPISLILALPSMVESVMDVYPNQVGRVNNLSSGVFGATSGLGEVIGPLFGASMYEYTGFRMTSDMTAMVTFFYVFIFIFVITNGQESITNALTRDENEEESKVD